MSPPSVAAILAEFLGKRMNVIMLRVVNFAYFVTNLVKNHIQNLSIYLIFKKARINHRYGNIPVFIVSYPKSGTTWMQNIVYQILSDGDLSFEHIDQVSPFLEHAYILGVEDECIGKPVKTHLTYRYAPKSSSKYIYVYREGRDVAKSFYHHFITYNMFRGSRHEFINIFLAGSRDGTVFQSNWFNHVANWFDNPAGLDILFVGYHELKADLPGQIRRISEFLGVNLSAEKISSIAAASTFEYMKSHEHKFRLVLGVAPVPGEPEAAASFIRVGEVGGGRSFMDDDETREYLSLARQKIPDHVLKKLGL